MTRTEAKKYLKSIGFTTKDRLLYVKSGPGLSARISFASPRMISYVIVSQDNSCSVSVSHFDFIVPFLEMFGVTKGEAT